MINSFLNKPVIFDFILSLVIGIAVFVLREHLKYYVNLPSQQEIADFSSLLVTIGTTFIGFFLTVITVIVTFKNGFDNKESVCNYPLEQGTDEVKKSIFDTRVSKETQFYGSDLYKQVLKVFVNSTCEIGFAMLILLLLQTHIFTFLPFWLLLITILCFMILVTTVIRCLYVFRLYLNVHMH